MANDMMYMLMGAIGLLSLMAFIQRPEPTSTVAPPSQEIQQRIWEQIEAPIGPTPTAPTITTNACGSAHFAFPNFVGTPREGMGCIDSLDCQNHPPIGYPSYQECCPDDGTCFTR